MHDNKFQECLAPLIEYGHIEGWQNLADYFCSIGIDVTGGALEVRRRRYGIPTLGGGARGRVVYFTPVEIDAWVRHLTRHSLKAWLAKQHQLRLRGVGDRLIRPVRQPHNALPRLPQFELYGITSGGPGYGEQVLRARHGYMYAARDPAVFEDVCSSGALDDGGHAWRYSGAWNATNADLRPPSPRWRRRSRCDAGRLIGAFVLHGSVLRWCRVPGDFFGLRSNVSTQLLTSRSLPRFADVLTWIKCREPEVRFVTWLRRVEVEPVSLEEMPSPTLAELVADVGDP